VKKKLGGLPHIFFKDVVTVESNDDILNAVLAVMGQVRVHEAAQTYVEGVQDHLLWSGAVKRGVLDGGCNSATYGPPRTTVSGLSRLLATKENCSGTTGPVFVLEARTRFWDRVLRFEKMGRVALSIVSELESIVVCVETMCYIYHFGLIIPSYVVMHFRANLRGLGCRIQSSNRVFISRRKLISCKPPLSLIAGWTTCS
jgi:hypothetical protein